MPLVTSEFNYQRKSHRIDIPMVVEVGGRAYQTKDWSLGGVAVIDFDPEVQLDEKIFAKCVLPMSESLVALNVVLKFKHRRGDTSGFEFHELSEKNRRVLRHYMELAVEGRLDNLEDVISVMSAPTISSPLQEAISISDRESESMRRAFRVRSVFSILLGVVFLVTVVTVLFYNTAYRIHATGSVAGNLDRVTTNASGIVNKIEVPTEAYVAQGQPVLRLSDPELEQQMREIGRELVSLEAEARAVAERLPDDGPSLIATLRRDFDESREQLGKADSLYDQRVITKKDHQQVYNQFLRAELNYARELDKIRTTNQGHSASVSRLANAREALLERRRELTERMEQLVLRAPEAGKIFNILPSEGSYVQTGEPVFLIERDLVPDILFRVRSDDALKLHVGMSADVYVPFNDAHYGATLTSIGYAAVNGLATTSQEVSLNETLVKLTLDDKDVRLPANSRVKVWIRTF